jgi:hypothetical protein
MRILLIILAAGIMSSCGTTETEPAQVAQASVRDVSAVCSCFNSNNTTTRSTLIQSSCDKLQENVNTSCKRPKCTIEKRDDGKDDCPSLYN